MIVTLDAASPQVAGSKAATLGRLIQAGFPVPPGFVIPVEAYRAVVRDLDLPGVLARHGADHVRRLVQEQPLPPWLLASLGESLAELGGQPVAVRSSATTEDTVAASAAGQHDSYLGIVGLPAVADKVRASWASLWSRRAIAYRQTHSSSVAPGMAVIVQRHVDADVAGVLFTAGPYAADVALLEASWGLGESVAQGEVTPDAYTVAAHGVVERRLGDKQTRIDRGGTAIVTTPVTPAQQSKLCLTDADVRRLWRLGQDVAAHLGSAQDIEFAVTGDRLWLLQARPVTAAAPQSRSEARVAAVDDLLHGTGGSPGIASGPARVLTGPADFDRVRRGDILVCRFTDPAWTPLFAVAAGVVTETGGVLCHAAIVAREHRIPAVLGVAAALTALSDGQQVTIDGTAGTVSPHPSSPPQLTAPT